jgi:dolichol-phosphate mannosyltransferase
VLSVIVPAYREGPYIYAALQKLLESLDALERGYEVIVVSDGNIDETEREARRVRSRRVRVLHYEQQRGKGYALRYGFQAATGSIVAFIDADMELHPSGIDRLLQILESEDVDVVVGAKTHPESKVQYPAFRRFQSSVFRRLARVLFRLDVSDTQTGLKVFRRPPLDAAMPVLQSEGFAFDLELLVMVNDLGYRIVEGPVELDYQFASTTGLRAAAHVFVETLGIAKRRRRLRRQGRWVRSPGGEATEAPLAPDRT